MKPKSIAFPRKFVLTSSAVMAVLCPLNSFAADFTWGGVTSSDWTLPGNWTAGTAPVYGTSYLADTLRISNGTGAGAVYNPGSALTTTFGAGRAFILGSTTAGSLTVTSGTLAAVRVVASGNEPIMANGANASLLINGGALDLSGHLNTFLFLNSGTANTSNLTISSGSFSSNGFNLQQSGTGVGTINLDGGSMAVTAFTRVAATGSTTFNLDSGTLRARGSSTSFLPALTGLQTIVEDGGAVIDTNGFNITIAEVLEHDTTLGVSPDGGLTKNGTGILTLSGASTFTGPVTINAGTALATSSRILLASDTGAGTGTITMADSFTEIQLNNGRNIANPITISNNGDTKELLLPAGGSFVGANFSGAITINETSSVDNFRVRTDDNCFLTFSGVVSGPGGIFKYQPGRLNLTNGSNTFLGDVKITHGEVSFTTGGLGTTGLIRMEGNTGIDAVSLRWDPTNDQDISSRLVMYAGKTATFNLAEQASPADLANVTFASAIGNGTTASLTKAGPGTLTLTQASTYTGGSTLTQGTLEFPNDGLGTSGAVTMNNGILRWATGNTQDLSSRIVMVNGRTAFFSTNGNDVTFASAIGSSSTASFTKTNTLGTLTLNGANTHSGTTTVSGGILKIGSTTSLGVFGPQTTTTIGTTIGSGATLDLNGTTGINEVITLSGTGVGDNGALVNNSGTPASTSNLIAGFTVPAIGSGATNYSTAPTAAISGTGTGATATASLGVTATSFGVNVAGDRVYTAAPNVTISGGGGSGATATAVLSLGATGTVIGITVTSAGSGFTTAPTAVISGGTFTGTTTTTFTGNAANFTVGGLTLTNAGSGYTGTPTFTFDGSPATVTTTYSSAILAANSSIGGTGSTTINGVVSESGSSRALTKVGAGTVTLNGANTYTGETKVDAGTLAINTDDTLANAAAVRIDSSAFLNLGFVGTDTVDRLFIGSVEQASGTWGSLASSATNKTARITGSGILDVTNGAAPANNYAAWANSQTPPVTGGVNGDSDQDGVPNLVEYALVNGGERGVFNTSTNTITFTKRGAPYGGDITYDIESSTLLTAGSWTTLNKPSPVIESASSISYTLTPGSPVKNFARLKVVQVP